LAVAQVPARNTSDVRPLIRTDNAHWRRARAGDAHGGGLLLFFDFFSGHCKLLFQDLYNGELRSHHVLGVLELHFVLVDCPDQSMHYRHTFIVRNALTHAIQLPIRALNMFWRRCTITQVYFASRAVLFSTTLITGLLLGALTLALSEPKQLRQMLHRDFCLFKLIYYFSSEWMGARRSRRSRRCGENETGCLFCLSICLLKEHYEHYGPRRN
jgi:hypothetical protein